MNQFPSIDWNYLKSLPPGIGVEDLRIPFAQVASTPEGRCFSQIGEYAFAETSELLSLNPEECRFCVSCFYWAPSVAALRRAALREMHCDIQTATQPPQALLLAPNCCTFKNIVEHAQLGESGRFAISVWHKEGDGFRKSNAVTYHHVFKSKDQRGNPVAFVGRCVRIERIGYHFGSEDDPMERFFAISLDTNDLYWEITD